MRSKKQSERPFARVGNLISQMEISEIVQYFAKEKIARRIYNAINRLANKNRSRTRTGVGGRHPGHLTRRQN